MSKLDEYVEQVMDNDRVIYDSVEVEELIRQAWLHGMQHASDLIKTLQLRTLAQTDQLAAQMDTVFDKTNEVLKMVVSDEAKKETKHRQGNHQGT